jgi:hypothetical protein
MLGSVDKRNPGPTPKPAIFSASAKGSRTEPKGAIAAVDVAVLSATVLTVVRGAAIDRELWYWGKAKSRQLPTPAFLARSSARTTRPVPVARHRRMAWSRSSSVRR